MHLEVDEAATTDELDQALECCDSWRYEIEGLPNPVSMNNKDAFVQNAIRFHVLVQRQSCYDQLVEGLKYYEVSLALNVTVIAFCCTTFSELLCMVLLHTECCSVLFEKFK